VAAAFLYWPMHLRPGTMPEAAILSRKVGSMEVNTTPFYVFFGILGLVAGALIVWFVMAEHPFENPEVPGGPVDEAEAALLAEMMAQDGRPMDEATVARLLELHGDYVIGKIREAQAAADERRIEEDRAGPAKTATPNDAG
jgi:hypothetical protein